MLIDIIKKIQSDIDSDQEKLELIKIFTPLINSYKSKFYSDDITSELIIKILLIAKKINIDGFMLKEHNSEDINKKIFSYFQNAIHNKYVDLVKAILSEKSILYKDYIIPEVIDPYEHIIANDYIMNLLNQLSKNQKKIITEIYINDKTQKQIAKEYNISKQSVSNYHRRALRKLGNIIINNERRTY